MQMRKCSTCKETKPEKEFSKSKFKPSGFHYQCKSCVNETRRKTYQKPENKEKNRKPYLATGKEQNRVWARKRLYGITPEQFEEMLQRQGGVCFICQTPHTSEHSLAIDHCHKTGKIRGLLCQLCNRGLGNFKDSPERLQKAIDYLKK